MKQNLAHVALLVRDYDEAIKYFTKKLQFSLLEDTDMGAGKRWVLVAPAGATESCLLLAKAASPEQEKFIGNQAGGRVFLFLKTVNFWQDYSEMKARGVSFLEEPRRETYGDVVVFEDLYGNKWDLLG